MKNLFIRGLAYVAMFILIVFIALPIGIIWNFVLISDMIFTNIKRRYNWGIKEMKKNDQKREESHK
ncbi:MAG: hypothetical protein RLZZ196_674 [Bacteroidota bacterium]|jgi:hypothetical protein